MAKGKTEIDVVHYLLTAAQQYDPLRDEIYCQLIKQTTNNKSERAEARFIKYHFAFVYLHCNRAAHVAGDSWSLSPRTSIHLIHSSPTCAAIFRQQPTRKAANSTVKLQHHLLPILTLFLDQAMICLRNLKQTRKFGGRKVLPDGLKLLTNLDRITCLYAIAVAEIGAVLAGKYTKIQRLALPGDRSKSIKIHAVTVRLLS